MLSAIPIARPEVSVYEIPTDFPEADGTIAWQQTTMVVVRVAGGGREGLGFTYGARAAGAVVRDVLAGAVAGTDALDVERAWSRMNHAVRNIGRPGIASTAVAAVDAALWDLKARLLDLPLVRLLGAVRESVMVYGSGGFTSYPLDRLREQLAGWVAGGMTAVKMKIGEHPEADRGRIEAARAAIGDEAALFIDANGAYDRKQALALAEDARRWRVSWFEEPVSSDDLAGLALLRDRAPPEMEIAAGEYGYDLAYFRRMIEAGAVDVLQADATRCAGITGFMKTAALCEAFGMPLSAHTAPAIHAHPCCAAQPVRHLEYFHDHARIEAMLFDGVPKLESGRLVPSLDRPGLGLTLRAADAARYAV